MGIVAQGELRDKMPKIIEDIPNACPVLHDWNVKNWDLSGMCPFQKTANPDYLVSLACVDCCRSYAKPDLQDDIYKRDYF